MEIRTVAESEFEAVARIHIDSWSDAYVGILPDELLKGRTLQGSLAGWKSTFSQFPENITVAIDDNEIRAFCCAGPVVDPATNGPFEFQVYGLHTAPLHRRRGLGAALMRHAFDRAHAAGQKSAIVWTLQDLLLSRRFYEREGGRLVKTGTWNIAGRSIPEVAYGWEGLGFAARPG